MNLTLPMRAKNLADTDGSRCRAASTNS